MVVSFERPSLPQAFGMGRTRNPVEKFQVQRSLFQYPIDCNLVGVVSLST